MAYSSKDLVYKDEIRKRLKPLLRTGKATVWDNYDIEAGAHWDTEVREKLHAADLILLLLSPDALDSDYFYEVEAPIALERHKSGQALAVGVLLRPCPLKHTPFEFAQYELLPKKGYPVTDPHWPTADAAYLSIFEEIDLLVEKIGQQRDAATSGAHIPLHAGLNDPFADLMIRVEGGSFDMGSNEDEREKPVHRVTVKDFYLCKYPVTQAQWLAIMKSNPSRFKGDDLPVENVSWNDMQVFLQKLSETTGKNYRLPSEAEWEYAARGGVKSNGYRFAGSNDADHVAWFSANSDQTTHPVGQKRANELDIHDMSGNLWEWCADSWHDNYKDAPTDGSAWVDAGANTTVLRGGSWYSIDYYCQSVRRIRAYKTEWNYYRGFRLARDA